MSDRLPRLLRLLSISARHQDERLLERTLSDLGRESGWDRTVAEFVERLPQQESTFIYGHYAPPPEPDDPVGLGSGNPFLHARASGSHPMAGVSRDASSLIYAPATGAEWDRTMSAAGITTGSPASVWLAQEASGDLADSIGSDTLTAAGSPGYQQSVSGWTRKAVTWNADGSATSFSNTGTVPNPDANSIAILIYAFTTGAPAADRQVIQIGASTAVEARVTTATKYQCFDQAVGSGTEFASTYNGAVHPLLLVYNRALTTMKLYAESEFASATYASISGPGVFLGAGDKNTPAGGVLFAAGWTGTAAELTDADVRSLLGVLGWTVAW